VLLALGNFRQQPLDLRDHLACFGKGEPASSHGDSPTDVAIGRRHRIAFAIAPIGVATA
jgi:hypothetical protein